MKAKNEEKKIENCQRGHGLLSIFLSFTDLKMKELICKRTIKTYKLIVEEIELGESKHLVHLFGMMAGRCRAICILSLERVGRPW